MLQWFEVVALSSRLFAIVAVDREGDRRAERASRKSRSTAMMIIAVK
jgi:hypothetical protein